MLYVILSVICSVLVGVLLKILKKHNVHLMQLILWNYVIALALCFVFYKPDLTLYSKIPWWLVLVLAIMLPSVFLIQAKSIQSSGIVKTDVAQRVSLIIAIFSAFFIFNESFNQLKILGLIVGFLAILFLLWRSESQTHKNSIYLLLVFLGFGTIDVLFKLVSGLKNISFTDALFFILLGSFIVALSINLFFRFKHSTKFKRVNMYWGMLLGILNFGNILFYLKAHKSLSESPSIVFASMNLGVILLGALLGVWVFKEKLSKTNYLGMLLALIAIVVITFSMKD